VPRPRSAQRHVNTRPNEKRARVTREREQFPPEEFAQQHIPPDEQGDGHKERE
jgi:hypothetical protein